jgi:hypothetical protein
MSRATLLLAAVSLASVALAPASAGASATRPPLALTATPAHISLVGSGRASLRVTNPGRSPVVVDVGRAGFSLDLRGRPRVVPRGGVRAAVSWLAVRPARFPLAAGASRSLTVSSRVPERAEPGDHDALVLLTTRPRRRTGVVVRMRIGVVVVVRAPGRVVRRLALSGLRVRPARGARILELGVSNRGNVTETLERGRLWISLQRGAAHTRLRADGRDLRPRTSGIVQVVYRGRLKGWVTARAQIAAQPGRPGVMRTFRLEL